MSERMGWIMQEKELDDCLFSCNVTRKNASEKKYSASFLETSEPYMTGSQPQQPQKGVAPSHPRAYMMSRALGRTACLLSSPNPHGACLQGRAASFISLCVIGATLASFDVALSTDKVIIGMNISIIKEDLHKPLFH